MFNANRRPGGGSVLILGCLLVICRLSPAEARVACGTEKAISSGQIFRVVAGGVGCTTAKAVAGGWFDATLHGKSGRDVVDQRHKRWTCRVTERATGSDPGYIPFTSVRCARHRAVVRFKQRS
jgi:sugar/nucleoside kinase (ribokinase family)